MKIKTADLIGPALDWAVAKCEGHDPLQYDAAEGAWHMGNWLPSIDWAQGGPIIEREQIDLRSSVNEKSQPVWIAEWWAPATTPQELRTKRLRSNQYASDAKSLVAAMRCFCSAKLGDEIDVPEELCQQQSI